MELLQQHFLPQRLQFRRYFRRDRGSGCPPKLRLAQQSLASTIAHLGSRLTGERAAVGFEIQLAVPHGHSRTADDLGLDVGKELVGRAGPHLRGAGKVVESSRAFDHLACRAAAAVAVAVRHQRPIAPAVVAKVVHAVHDLFADNRGVVHVDRRKVRQYFRTVESLPLERAVRELVGLVPAQLLRNEAVAPAGAENLGQRRRVAEHIGKPCLLAAHSEPRLEVALAVHKLAHQAFAAGQVHVGLDPHATDRLPLAAGYPLANAIEQRRVVLFHPFVLRRLRTREAKLGIGVHHARCAGERARTFAHRLADRPQPGGINVCVPNSHYLVRARSGGQLQRRLQQATSGHCGTGNVAEIERVESGL